MKVIACLLVILAFSESFSQKSLSYKEVRNELENSSESLNTTLILLNSDFYIAITKDAIVDNPELNACIDIQSDNIKNKQIIRILEKHNLLDKLYVRIENEYVNLSSSQTFNPEETELYLELFYKTNNFEVMSCFVPVFERKKAKELIWDFNKVFDNSSCFNKMINSMVPLNNK